MMARTKKLKEWIGKTDDAMPPANVRQRILDSAGGICCLCQGAITKPGWHAHHVKGIEERGENRESNIKPAHAVCHLKETARQAIERAPVKRKKQKHSGAARPKGDIKSRGFAPPAEKPKKPAGKPMPPRRPLYTTGGLWPSGKNRED